MRRNPIRESSPVSNSAKAASDRNARDQDNMARRFKEPDASLLARPAYSGLTGRRCASLCLHMWRGCRSQKDNTGWPNKNGLIRIGRKTVLFPIAQLLKICHVWTMRFARNEYNVQMTMTFNTDFYRGVAREKS